MYAGTVEPLIKPGWIGTQNPFKKQYKTNISRKKHVKQINYVSSKLQIAIVKRLCVFCRHPNSSPLAAA